MSEDVGLRPGVVTAIGLLCGMTLLPGGALEVSAACSVVLVVAWRRSTAPIRTRVLVAASILLGLLLASHERQEARRSIPAWIAPPGESRELGFEGVLLDAPEAGTAGERSFRTLATPLAQPGAELPGDPLRLEVRVAASPEEATLSIDKLGAGDVVALWCRIRTPRRAGNPGSRDPVSALRVRNVQAICGVKSARLVERVSVGRPGPRRWAGEIRKAAANRLDRSFGDGSGETRAILGAMLLGERSALSVELLRTLRDAGLTHLIAISGLHVGLLVLAVAGSSRRARIEPWVLVAICAFLLPAFALIVGGRPSVTRAVLGAGLVLIGRATGRDGDALNGLGWLAVLILVFQPGALGSPAFQLTFLATAGILCFARSITAALPLPGPLAAGAGVTVAAYLATVPAVAFHFGRLAPIGLLANLVAVPLCAATMLGGYAALVATGVPWASEATAAVADGAVRALLFVARHAAAIDGGAFPVPTPSLSGVVGPYLLLALLARPRVAPSRRAVRLLLVVLLLSLHLGPAPRSGRGQTQVAVLDVGQGQAVAVLGAADGAILVDAGGSHDPRFDVGERTVVPFLRRHVGRRLDALILSHEDADHAGGAFAVLRDLEVGELWFGPGAHRHPRIRALLRLARRRGTVPRLVERGVVETLGGLPLQVLAPAREDALEPANERSLVVRLGEASSTLLIPGDLGQAGERRLIAAGASLQSTALVLPHHGSRNGSTRGFLEAVRPRIAIVSAAYRGRFGHPHTEALERAASAGAEISRTDLDGLVLLTSEARGWRLQTTRPRPGSARR